MAGIKFGGRRFVFLEPKKILETWGARMTDQEVPYSSVLSIIFRTLTMEPEARLDVVTDRCSMRRQLPPLPQTCFTSWSAARTCSLAEEAAPHPVPASSPRFQPQGPPLVGRLAMPCSASGLRRALHIRDVSKTKCWRA